MNLAEWVCHPSSNHLRVSRLKEAATRKHKTNKDHSEIGSLTEKIVAFMPEYLRIAEKDCIQDDHLCYMPWSQYLQVFEPDALDQLLSCLSTNADYFSLSGMNLMPALQEKGNVRLNSSDVSFARGECCQMQNYGVHLPGS